MFVTITTIVEGALESEEDFTDYLFMNQHLEEIAADAASDGYRTEVYALEHQHDPTDDGCDCIQYEQSHKPAIVHNPDGPGSATIGHYAAH